MQEDTLTGVVHRGQKSIDTDSVCGSLGISDFLLDYLLLTLSSLFLLCFKLIVWHFGKYTNSLLC